MSDPDVPPSLLSKWLDRLLKAAQVAPAVRFGNE
jgi:hypothetical protein